MQIISQLVFSDSSSPSTHNFSLLSYERVIEPNVSGASCNVIVIPKTACHFEDKIVTKMDLTIKALVT